jgi:hypothetical protein
LSFDHPFLCPSEEIAHKVVCDELLMDTHDVERIINKFQSAKTLSELFFPFNDTTINITIPAAYKGNLVGSPSAVHVPPASDPIKIVSPLKPLKMCRDFVVGKCDRALKGYKCKFSHG